jgi:hypothetical protein
LSAPQKAASVMKGMIRMTERTNQKHISKQRKNKSTKEIRG